MVRWLELVILTAMCLPAQVVIGARTTAPGTIRVDVDLVNVLCSVREKDGTWAKDLTRADFEVREDGRVRPITHFAADTDSPMTVALLLDVSGSVATILDIEKAAASRFFDEVLRPGDNALLAGFSDTIPIWQDLTGSRSDLQAALRDAGPGFSYRNAETRPRGGTLLYDAVDLAAKRKLRSVTGRKTMILITDGLDNGSVTKLEKSVQSAQEADAVVFAIHYVPESRDSADGMKALERIAEPTGGRAFHVSKRMPLERVFAEIADEMRHQYSLGFAPASHEKDGSFHKLEIKVLRPGLKAQSRNGYYAVPR